MKNKEDYRIIKIFNIFFIQKKYIRKGNVEWYILDHSSYNKTKYYKKYKLPISDNLLESKPLGFCTLEDARHILKCILDGTKQQWVEMNVKEEQFIWYS